MPVIDVHAHLEERMLDLPSMIAQLDARGVDQVALIPSMLDPLPATPELLLSALRKLMLSRWHPIARKINDLTLTRDGDLRLGRRIYQIYSKPDNETVARAIAAHPDRFLGWIFLNPRAGVGLDELERWRGTPGFLGVKLHPHWHGWDTGAALPIARRCEELGLSILVHLGFGERGRWKVLADACPRLRIIFAHAGIPHWPRMWDEVRGDKRLWVDVSSPYLDEALVRTAVAAVGPDRVMYGTDAPYGFHTPSGAYDYGAIKGWVERLPVGTADVERMLGGNALSLIDRRA
jgi:predicted TIM-barrel fold metal-dependent hydrolase